MATVSLVGFCSTLGSSKACSSVVPCNVPKASSGESGHTALEVIGKVWASTRRNLDAANPDAQPPETPPVFGGSQQPLERVRRSFGPLPTVEYLLTHGLAFMIDKAVLYLSRSIFYSFLYFLMVPLSKVA